MLPALETPPLKDFFLMLGRGLVLVLAAVIVTKIFPSLNDDNFKSLASEIITLAVIWPTARKLGFDPSRCSEYLSGLKAQLRPAFLYFLVMMAFLPVMDYAYTFLLAPWDLSWTNTLLFWNDQSSNPFTLDARIEGLLENPLLLPGYFIAGCVLAPLAEEFIMRRWAYAAMRKYMPAAAAILFNGFLFGLLHGRDFMATAAHGFFFCWAYERTGKLETPILIHAISNLFALLLIFGGKLSGFSD